MSTTYGQSGSLGQSSTRQRNAFAGSDLDPYVLGMSAAEGFEYEVRGSEVVITHHGIRAVVLRGRRAVDFLEDVENEDPQLLMARMTGNYRRGNERTARQHPRNRHR